MVIKDYRGKSEEIKIDSDAILLAEIVYQIIFCSNGNFITIEKIMNAKVISDHYTKEDVLSFMEVHPICGLFETECKSNTPNIKTYKMNY